MYTFIFNVRGWLPTLPRILLSIQKLRPGYNKRATIKNLCRHLESALCEFTPTLTLSLWCFIPFIWQYGNIYT